MATLRITDPRTGVTYSVTVPDGFTVPEDPAKRAEVLRRLGERGMLAPVDATDTAAPPTGGTGTGDPIRDRADALVAEMAASGRGMGAGRIPARPIMAANLDEALSRGGYTREDFASVPAGQGVNVGSGITFYPNEDTWARTGPGGVSTPEAEQAQLLEQAALADRARAVERGGLSRVAQGIASNPWVAGAVQGLSTGLGDEGVGVISPQAGAAMQQDYYQAAQENPYQTMGGELLGTVGQIMATRKIPGVARTQDALVGLPTRYGVPAMAGTSAAYGAAYRAAQADPWQSRMDEATDPVGIAIDAGFGAAIPGGIAAFQRGRRALNDMYPNITPGGVDFGGGTSMPYGMGQPVYDAQNRAQLEGYLDSLVPSPQPAQGIQLGEAALDLGVELPQGMVTSPERYARSADRVTDWTRDRMRGLQDRAEARLGNRFGDIVTENAIPTSPGEAGDRLRASVMANLDRRIDELSLEYQSLSDQMAGVHDLPSNVGTTLDEVFQRRFAAGSETDEDTAFIGEIANLVRRNALPSGADPADAAHLPGVTWEGLQDARSLLRTQTSNYSRGQQLTPKQRDMITMENSITEAMESMVRQSAPEGEAARAVEAFRDLDRQYAITQETRRQMNDMLTGESTSIMKQLGRALQQGGQTSVDTINTLKRNASTEDWNNTKAVLLHQLGADDAGRFDPQKFASQWDRVAPDARAATFDKGHLRDLDNIARVGREIPKIVGSGQRVGGIPTSVYNAGANILAGITLNPISILGNLASQGFRGLTARALTSPLTARHLSQMYKQLESISKSNSDAQRALGVLRLNRQAENFEKVTGTPLVPGISATPTQTTTGATSKSVGRVGD